MSNQKYRDSIFRHYFSEDKARLLTLLNALLGTDSTDPNEIEINTLEGAFLSSFKNDISCIFRGQFIVLLEHQSTLNDNMPTRLLIYFVELMKQYIGDLKKLLRPKLIKIPSPRFFVLYNGREPAAEAKFLSLADALGDEQWLKIKVEFLNINEGQNAERIARSRHLMQYCVFVNRVERDRRAGVSLQKAIEDAVHYCVEHDIMTEYLTAHLWEVENMNWYEFTDEEIQKAMLTYEREEGREEGRAEGLAEGRNEALIGSIRNLMETMSLTAQQAMTALKIPSTEQSKYLALI